MASEDFQPIQGMSDIVAPEVGLWQHLESTARDVLGLYGYTEIRTPILEKAAVFIRAMGDGTDVVQKEMYVFQDRGGRQLAVRPEGTASVIRHVAGAGQDAQDARLFYMGPMFRCERPQAGRKRQFHQLGAEAVGAPSPAADVECLAMQIHLLKAWGLHDFKVHVNTRGSPEDRVAVQAGFLAALQPHAEALCEDCRRRMGANVLRVLDCKQEGCRAVVRGLPQVTDFMSEEARQYLAEVVRLLQALDLPFHLNPALVRGLDYYAHTVWEITHPALGSQDALAGGGRYRIEMGGRAVEGVGFAMGLERVLMAVQRDAPDRAPKPAAPVWLVAQGSRAAEDNLKLAQMLRLHGCHCGLDVQGRSMKAQMRHANRVGASLVLLRGDAEMDQGVFLLKNMADGTQETLELPALMARLAPTRS